MSEDDLLNAATLVQNNNELEAAPTQIAGGGGRDVFAAPT
jgi:hypothetical protein